MNAALAWVEGTFWWVLYSSMHATVIIGLILLLRFLLRNRLAGRWQAALWLVLLARMLMPAAPESGFSVFNWVALDWSAGEEIALQPFAASPATGEIWEGKAAEWIFDYVEVNAAPPVEATPPAGEETNLKFSLLKSLGRVPRNRDMDPSPSP